MKFATCILFSLALSGCVTTAQKSSCFDFDTSHCVALYRQLSEAERSSTSGQKLHSEICSQPDIRCVEESGNHQFALKKKMAEEGYDFLLMQSGNGVVSGIFQHAGNDSGRKQSVQDTLKTSQYIKDCERSVLLSCEKIVARSSFGVEFEGFLSHMPPETVNMARQQLCKDKSYKCLTFNHGNAYDPPKGWRVVQNVTLSSIKDGKTSVKRDVILVQDSAAGK